MPVIPDYNGQVSEGVCRTQMNTHHGARFSTVHGYVRPARGRANLTVRTDAPIDRVTVSGNRATGIAFTVADKHAPSQRAAR